MDAAMPAWFQCDQIYSQGSQWFIGSQESLHIGPYGEESVALSKSEEFCRKLKRMVNDGDRLRYVRKLLNDEWDEIGPDAHLEVEEISMGEVEEPVRAGEAQKQWYRSNRFFQVDGIWFFSTREGLDVGPFDTEKAARLHETKLKSLLIKCTDVESAKRTILEYKHRPEKIQIEVEGYRQFSQRTL